MQQQQQQRREPFQPGPPSVISSPHWLAFRHRPTARSNTKPNMPASPSSSSGGLYRLPTAPRPTAVEWTPSCPAISGSAAASRRRFRNTFAGLPATRLSVRRRSTRLSPGSTETNSRRMDSLLARNGLPACLPFSGPSLLFLLCRRFFSAAHVQTPCTR